MSRIVAGCAIFLFGVSYGMAVPVKGNTVTDYFYAIINQVGCEGTGLCFCVPRCERCAVAACRIITNMERYSFCNSSMHYGNEEED